LHRLQAGDLALVVAEDRHPSASLAHEPYCTRSQIVGLVTSRGKQVVLAHRYLRPDGTIGASGLLDPKIIVDRDAEHRLDDW
jgi:hypothetical protein